jgi:hypothetical protein|tara:strand:+ start:649 stop:1056 length:408 start_codon:yes stop_codon:yes gene_type:complete
MSDNVNTNTSNFTYDALTSLRKVYIDGIVEYGSKLGINLEKDTFCRAELRQISMSMKGKKWIPNWITHEHTRRAGVGLFHLPEVHEKYNASFQVSPSETVIEENGQAKWASNKLKERQRLEAAIDAEVPYESMSW